MANTKKHADHDYIVARQERYVAAYRKADSKAMMEFMDEDDFVYSDFGGQREGIQRDQLHGLFDHTFSNFHDLKMRTVSLHGHKHFTAWEWVITCKRGFDESGKRVPKDKAPRAKLKGCSLMWWNDKDKITKQHDYVQVRDPDDES